MTLDHAVVVVLHQPTPDDLARLARTAARADRLLVVDNSPEPVPGLAGRLGPGARVLHNANRGGLAGAYNLAAREALADPRCPGFFLLDQDSEVDDDYFETMAAHCDPLARGPFVVGPRIYETTMEIFMVNRPPPASSVVPRRPSGADLVPAEFVISSGALISAEAFATIGLFAEDLFIECIDLEYCLRGWARGVPTYVDTGLTLEQRTGNVRRTSRGFAFDYSATRYYYRVRNCVWTLRHYLPWWAANRRAARFTLQQMRLVVRDESEPRAKLAAMTRGAWHGMRGRLGP